MKLQEGLVSIVTPVYNSEFTIAETIQSVQAQTYGSWEMLIVMDRGTTDRTAEIVQTFADKDSRINFFRIKNDQGISLARNLALKNAQGQFVAFLDSDDLWLPEKLAHQIAFMKKENANFSCTGYRRISHDGKQLGYLRVPPPRQNYDNLLKNNLISCPTVLFDQSKLGFFQMSEHPHEDYILWLAIIKKAKICFGLEEDLARYRIGENSRSMNVNRPGSRWKIYRSFENLSLVKAAYYFFHYALSSACKRIQH